MDYIAPTDVTVILPQRATVGASTVPLTLGEVGSIAAEVESELNSAAAQAGYSVPVTAAASYAFALMQAKAKDGVGCRILKILLPNMGGGPGQRTTLADTYCSSFEKFVKALRAGDITLVDAPAAPGTGARELPRSWETSHHLAPSPMVRVGQAF